MIRVLVAEDSPTARELLVALIGAEADMQVVGQARDGREAVEAVLRLRPDVLTMDVHMPLLDGFEATRRVMTECPTPIVIVSASLDVRDVETSMRALRAGALAILPKPVGPSAPGFERESRELVATVRAMSQVRVVRRWAERPARQASEPKRTRRPRLLAIAASTGGPAAIQSVLSGLPPGFPAPIVLVQHIATGFLRGFAAWLDGCTPFRARVGADGMALAPGTVYVAPDDLQTGVASDGVLRLSAEALVDGFRPSASHLFASAAEAFGADSVCVVLTGMGRDGTAGLRAVRERGGTILAQDEESCVVYGMPRAAIEAGLADEVLPLQAIAPRLIDLFR